MQYLHFELHFGRNRGLELLKSSRLQHKKSRNHFDFGINLLLAQYHSAVNIVVDEELFGTHIRPAPASYAVNGKESA